MGVTTTQTNKPLNPRGNDQSPLAYNRAKLFSGKALDFDGVNDYVDLDGFTMSGNTGTFCFYADVDNDAYIFDVNPNRFIFLHNTAQGIRVFNTNGWSDYGLIDRETTLFYTIVCDGTSQSVYVNGQKFGDTKTITALDLSAATELKLGSNYLGNGTFYNGTLSNYRIFNTALTAAQVADLYNNPEKVVPTGVANTALKLWLPMMEGAGTTAYDGSGNGNHGTISGATWTHGVGSPVAQSAVMDWNKGSNLISNSEDFDGSPFTLQWATLTANAAISPLGLQNAYNFVPTTDGTGNHRIFDGSGPSIQTATHSVFIKPNGHNYWALRESATTGASIGFDFTDNSIITEYSTGGCTASNGKIEDYGNGWYRISGTFSFASATTQGFGLYAAAPTWTSGDVESVAWAGDGVSGAYIYGAQVSAGSLGPYIITTGTAQTSDVLLPQGLTSGRDITGVNLFENVRKQGALNLDGNSWAEVHDNASLDLTTAVTLEAWVYWSEPNTEGVLGRFGALTADRNYMLYALNSTTIEFYINTIPSEYTSMTSGWRHIVGTYDGANRKLYVDGVLRDTDAMTAAISTSDKPIEIGRYRHGSVSNLEHEDQIAQPRIYNRALTAEEVQRNYNAGKNTYTN